MGRNCSCKQHEIIINKRHGTSVNMSQHLNLEDTLEERRGMSAPFQDRLGVKALCIFISDRKNFSA